MSTKIGTEEVAEVGGWKRCDASMPIGALFAAQCINNVVACHGDALSTAEDLLMSLDKDTALYQLDREIDRAGANAVEEVWMRQKSLLHYSVLLQDRQFVSDLLDRGASVLVCQQDYITRFTPLHFALFIEHAGIMELLLSKGAKIDQEDAFFGTVSDYALMLGILEQHEVKEALSLQVWNAEEQRIDSWPVQRFEKEFSVTFCPHVRCGWKYIEELLFSGFQISPDLEFRAKYLDTIRASSGDENLVLAWVSEEVGYGVFAAKDFSPGDYIVRYGGVIIGEDEITDWSYAMSAGMEGVVLDAKNYRNLAGMINHSEPANAEATGVFDKGASQNVILATEFIPRGTQVLINYALGSNYWEHKEQEKKEPVPLSKSRLF